MLEAGPIPTSGLVHESGSAITRWSYDDALTSPEKMIRAVHPVENSTVCQAVDSKDFAKEALQEVGELRALLTQQKLQIENLSARIHELEVERELRNRPSLETHPGLRGSFS